MALRRSCIHESPVRKGLSRSRAKPVVTHSESARETGKDRQHCRRKDSHNVVGGGAGNDRPALLRFPTQRVAEVGDKAVVGRYRWDRSCCTTEELRVRGVITFAWIRTGHEVCV